MEISYKEVSARVNTPPQSQFRFTHLTSPPPTLHLFSFYFSLVDLICPHPQTHPPDTAPLYRAVHSTHRLQSNQHGQIKQIIAEVLNLTLCISKSLTGYPPPSLRREGSSSVHHSESLCCRLTVVWSRPGPHTSGITRSAVHGSASS